MNRTDAIIDALEEVEYAARTVLRELCELEEYPEELDELSDALVSLDLVRSKEGNNVSK